VSDEKKKREIERRAKKQARRRVAWNGSRAGRDTGVIEHRCPHCGSLNTTAYFGPYFCGRCGAWFLSEELDHADPTL